MFQNDIFKNIKPKSDTTQYAIWGLEWESILLLSQVVNDRVYIKYFVDLLEKCVGETFLGKQIISKGELREDTEIYVLITKEQYVQNCEWVEKCLAGRYQIVELKTIKDEIRAAERLFIYGAGSSGAKTLKMLKDAGVQVDGFIDSDSAKVGGKWCEYAIYERSSLRPNDVVIISSICFYEIYNALREVIDEQNIYIDYCSCAESDMLRGRPILFKDTKKLISVDMLSFFIAIMNDFYDKSVILYGVNELTQQVIEVLELLEVNIYAITEDESVSECSYKYPVKNVYELAYEDMHNKIIINLKDRVIKKEVFQELGLKYFLNYRNITNIVYGGIASVSDGLLDYSKIYEKTSAQYPGFVVYGNENTAKKRIVVLGGSTTDHGTYENLIKSWPEYLYEKCKDVVIYNGGMAGYDSTRECLKLLRDVAQLRPDLIISYSGVNDLGQPKKEGYPFTRTSVARSINVQCFGVKNDVSPDEYWIELGRYMNALAEVMGSRFLRILQPCLLTKAEAARTSNEEILYATGNPKRRFFTDYGKLQANVKETISQYDWLYDMTDAFDEVYENIYRGYSHVNNVGNQIIADRIFEIINQDYFELEKKE